MTSTALLADLRAGVRVREESVVAEWAGIVEWAAGNTVADPGAGVATIRDGFVDTGLPIAGEGAPLVSEFALMELIAVLGRSPDGGRVYVGRVLECAWRLPQVYASVMAGRLAPWRAERIAEATRPLCREAAAFVDRQLFNATGVGWAQLERLIAEAVIRFDPERYEAERAAATDHRYVEVGAADTNGLVSIDGLLDAADGADLDQAISRRATLLGRLGNEASLDVRRSQALGDLARNDLTLDLEGSSGRRAVLNVHITDTTLLGTGTGANPVGRWDQTPISAAQIREWLAQPGMSVTVRPVIDLADHVPVTAYEIPDRHRQQVELRDHTCRFPYCTRAAMRCDLDHATPHGQGGPTCPCNLVPLCRRHHRAKTHSTWRYQVTTTGTYLWRSPSGFHFEVSHRGTHPQEHSDDREDPEPGVYRQQPETN
ncbi:HNH endonuclease signature motif containing protein [Pimelobacter simplex]|uniref:HNH endonuclease signature motif containing protein n=2 Tax=Nocardioides simplex TaxID=2045 RepID=UPI0005360C19|nr:HNH endonuclease signature motif containing protein [Pimelobacter simplex]